jgi:hypothetical protein
MEDGAERDDEDDEGEGDLPFPEAAAAAAASAFTFLDEVRFDGFLPGVSSCLLFCFFVFLRSFFTFDGDASVLSVVESPIEAEAVAPELAVAARLPP